MNLRGIKIIDLKHSVLDNSTVDKLQAEIAHFEERIQEVKDTKIDRREKDYANKEADRDQKLINFGVAITELNEQLKKEREAILTEQRRGIYRFKHKAYVNYRDAGRRPPYKFRWCEYSDRDNYGTYRDWQVSFGAEAVTFGKDRYVPEGVNVGVEEHFYHKDVILVKEDLQTFLRRAMINRARADGAGQSELNALTAEFAKEGGSLRDEDMESMLSDGGR